jgi:disulfide oxidoreductase YuzD
MNPNKIKAAASLLEDMEDLQKFVDEIKKYKGIPGEIRVDLDSDNMGSRNRTFSNKIANNSFLRDVIITEGTKRVEDIKELLTKDYSFEK